MRFRFEQAPDAIRQGLEAVKAEYPARFGDDGDTTRITFEESRDVSKGGFAVRRSGSNVQIRYGRRCDAFRALGRVMGDAAAGARGFGETPRFDDVGIMVDCSRNGVLLPRAAQSLLVRCALMGINLVMLYTEDTYEVPGEPFFGYLRGRYTEAELRALDAFADGLGIEMMPCIQTLAHLEQILQWPAYADVRDTHRVLLAEEPKTYALIERLLDAAMRPFRSKRIHLGMDEAQGIGLGHYRQRFGDKSAFDILNDHLARVMALCRARGLDPMIWSDMYFRIGSATHGYYDPDTVIPKTVSDAIPKDVALVYWDYYHHDRSFYCDWIERHRAMGFDPIVAPGVWTWNRLWASLPFSCRTLDACMGACKEKGVRRVFATLWGDDGMECNIFSALPGLQYFAEHAHADAVDAQTLRANFRGACDCDYDDAYRSGMLDAIPGFLDSTREENWSSATNPTKWLLWQDPFLGVMEPYAKPNVMRRHYEELADTLAAASLKSPEAKRLEFPALLARTVALKCELRSAIVAAYKAGDRARLQRIIAGDLAALRASVDALWVRHRELWLSTYKPFGLEVVEGRYGALRARLESLSARLQAFVAGEIAAIPEFDADLLRFEEIEPKTLPQVGYGRTATASCIR